MAEAKYTIAGNEGKRATRELLVTYLNVATYESPMWKPLGRTSSDSSIERDWSVDTKTGIYGEVFTSAKKPTKTQSFSDNDIIAGDEVQNHLIDIAVVREDVSEIVGQDVLIAHLYLNDTKSKPFAERYPASAVVMTTTGGEGGGMLVSDIDVTYGGTRETGTISNAGGTVTFTADGEE